MKKLFTANKYLAVSLALAAFTAAGAAPAFAQSSGAWSAGISTRNVAPLVHKQATQLSGYNSYARVPNYSATGPSSLGRPDPFGLNEWFQR